MKRKGWKSLRHWLSWQSLLLLHLPRQGPLVQLQMRKKRTTWSDFVGHNDRKAPRTMVKNRNYLKWGLLIELTIFCCPGRWTLEYTGHKCIEMARAALVGEQVARPTAKLQLMTLCCSGDYLTWRSYLHLQNCSIQSCLQVREVHPQQTLTHTTP